MLRAETKSPIIGILKRYENDELFITPDFASAQVIVAAGADVIGLDWRVPLEVGWKAVGAGCAVQGNLDPISLFAPEDVLKERVREVLTAAGGQPGHIFNLGHGIVPGTPVDNVIRVVEWVKELSAS